MTVAFTRTREQLAQTVLRKLGVLASGETPTADDLTITYEAIDMRLKEMHRLGVFWRKVSPSATSFTITANTASTTHAIADLLFPISMTVTVNGLEYPVDIIGQAQYNSIADKTQEGEPMYAAHSGSAFLFWPVPIANRTAKLVYEKIADDTATSTAPDVEVSMLRCLKDLVVYDLMDTYPSSETTMQRWAAEATIAEKNLRILNAQRVDALPVVMGDTDGVYAYTETDYGM